MNFLNLSHVLRVSAGASTVLSFGHFLLTFKSLQSDVPIHFDIKGRPDSFVGRRFYFVYPLMTFLLSSISCGIAANSKQLLREDTIAVTACLVGGNALLLYCQKLAGDISISGENKSIPIPVLAIVGLVFGGASVFSVVKSIQKE